MEEWRRLKKICANPNLLTEVSFSSHLEYPDGSVPMVAKTNTGRMSPVRARTLKEYDTQIQELKKENFNLKLRIYYLEERMNQKYGDEDVFKTNIQLKVDVESLRNQLADKQKLLQHASVALEAMSASHQEQLENEVAKVREDLEQKLESAEENLEISDKRLKDALNRIQELEDDVQKLATELHEANDRNKKFLFEIEDVKKKLAEKERQVGDLTGNLRETEDKIKEELDKLKRNVSRKDRDIQRLSVSMKENRNVDCSAFLELTQLQDMVDDQRLSLEKLQAKSSQQEQEIQKKNQMIGKLEDLLRVKDQEIKNFSQKIGELDNKIAYLTEGKEKRSALIAGLTEKLKNAHNMNADLESRIEELESELQDMQNKLAAAEVEKNKEHAALLETEDRVTLLKDQIKLHENELEKFVKTLGKKEGELAGFKELLKKADESLKQSEKAVENLEEQIHKERQLAEERLRDTEQKLKECTPEFKKHLEGRTGEIEKLKQALLEKEQKIDAANMLVLSMQQKIAELEKELEERDQKNKNALRNADIALQDALDGKASALEAKDRIIRRLQGSIESKEQELQVTFQQSPKTDDAKIHHLQQQLREKDKLLEEITADRKCVLERNDQELQALRQRLREREDAMDDLSAKYKKELSNYRKEIEDLQNEFIKKEAEFLSKLKDLLNIDAICHRLNITVSGDATLQQVLLEQMKDLLMKMRPEPQGDRSVIVEVNSSHQHSPLNRTTATTTSTSENGTSSKHGHSKIPVARKGSSENSDEVEMLKKRLIDAEAQIEYLNKTLKATEETVHHQTQKMKQYEGILVKHELLPTGLSPSNSESNLFNLSPKRSPEHVRSIENLTLGQNGNSITARSPSPPISLQLTMEPNTDQRDDISKLKDENTKLRDQVEGYRRLVNVLKSRSFSSEQNKTVDVSAMQRSDKGQDINQVEGQNTDIQNIDSRLDTWLMDIANFLQELGQQDQDGGFGGQGKPKISRLRQGLAHARGTIKSLSSASVATQDGTVSSSNRVASNSFPQNGSVDREDNRNDVFITECGPKQGLQTSSETPLPNEIHSHRDERMASTEQIRCRVVSGISDFGVSGKSYSTEVEMDNVSNNMQNIHSVHGNNSTGPRALYQQFWRGSRMSSLGYSRLSNMFDSSAQHGRLADREMSEETLTQSFLNEEHLPDFDQRSISQLSDFSMYADLDSDPRQSQAMPSLSEDKLKSRLSTMEQINKTMQEELTLYESLARKSLGDTKMDVLLQHLEELRALRIRMEKGLSGTGEIHEQMASTLMEEQEKQKNTCLLIDQEALIQDLQQLNFNLQQKIQQEEDNNKKQGLLLEENVKKTECLWKENQQKEEELLKSMTKIHELENLMKEYNNIENLITQKQQEIETCWTRNCELEATVKELESKLSLENPLKEKVAKLEIALKQYRENEGREQNLIKQYKDRLSEFEIRLTQYHDAEEHHLGLMSSLKEKRNHLEQQVKLLNEKDDKNQDIIKQKMHLIVEQKERISQLESNIREHKEIQEKQREVANELRRQLKSQNEEMTHLQELLHKNESIIFELKQALERSKSQLNEEAQNLQAQVEVTDKFKKDLDDRNERIKQLESSIKDHLRKLEYKSTIITEQKSKFEDKLRIISQQKQDLDRQAETIRQHEEKGEKQEQVIQLLQEKIRQLEDKLHNIQSEGNTKLQVLESTLAKQNESVTTLTRKNEKLDKNAKILLKELRKYQCEMKVAHSRLREKDDVNRSLKLELSVHERLNEANKQGASSENYHGILLDLLKEVKLLRTQMELFIEANENLRKQMAELLHSKGSNRGKDESPARSQGTDEPDGQPTPEKLRSTEISTQSEHQRSETDIPSATDVDKLLSMSSMAFGRESEGGLLVPEPIMKAPGLMDHFPSPDTTSSVDSGNIDEIDHLSEVGFGGSKSFGNNTWPIAQQDLPTPSSSKQMSLHSSLMMGSRTSLEKSPFCVPGPVYRQTSLEGSLSYRVSDSPKYVSVTDIHRGLMPYKVDSDLRQLFAVGKIDDFEKLQKENRESVVLLKGMEARVKERLKFFQKMTTSENVEYSTLKQLFMSMENLRICLAEEKSLIGCFWVTELPAPNEKGEFIDPKLHEENAELRLQLDLLIRKHEFMSSLVKDANECVHLANEEKLRMEEKIYQSLQETAEAVTQAKLNLEKQASRQNEMKKFIADGKQSSKSKGGNSQ
ncbi:hypothetical protein CHS0354_012867 [Potamilus streckersoni]|uniref:Centrosomin N-terminal motif 1 domain-containing protein n=1 Tax=Potamilus streckersoni TaxID=2493646 RepID=A0AAE0SW05_9BIVA|nr:hypothetical protein CHS0354_012867 [Potamilus streckersoni]